MRINPPIKASTLAQDLQGDDLWFPVRISGDDGHEFILLTEWGADYNHASSNRAKTDANTGPSWGKTNPVDRIVRLKIIAVED